MQLINTLKIKNRIEDFNENPEYSPEKRLEFLLSSGSVTGGPTWDSIGFQKKTLNRNFFSESLFSPIGQRILKEKYCFKNESIDDCIERVCLSFATNNEHAQRLFDYTSKGWLVFSTPLWASGGIPQQGLPISCYVIELEPDVISLSQNIADIMKIGSSGGGIGILLNKISSSKIIEICQVIEKCIFAFSNKVRRFGVSVFLHVNHISILEFITMRKPTGGDPRKKCLDLHHGVIISKDFIDAVESGKMWNLKDSNGEIVETIQAVKIWQLILTTQLETGEPYFFFEEVVEKYTPKHLKQLGMIPKLTNLCTEIFLPTGLDYMGNRRYGICNLSAVNLRFWNDFYNTKNINDFDNFILDVLEFQDNVLSYFGFFSKDILPEAYYSALVERSIGMGALGWHSLCQQEFLSLESEGARKLNKFVFSELDRSTQNASEILANRRGPCLDGKNSGHNIRFSNRMAIAPNATTGKIGGGSDGIEPIFANCFISKSGIGSELLINPTLEHILENKNINNKTTIDSILRNHGSIEHLCLGEELSSIFKTAHEINQMKLLDLAGDRTCHIDQGQSLNYFFLNNVQKTNLHQFCIKAARTVKSLYYNRTLNKSLRNEFPEYEKTKFDCIGCVD